MLGLSAIAGRLHARNARDARARRLPPLLLMTDPLRLPEPLAAAEGLPVGAGVILRAYEEPERTRLA